MSKRKKWLRVGLIVALTLTIIPFAVFAQGEPAPPNPEGRLLRALTETAAQVLNMEPQDFIRALREGKTPAQLAQEAGVPTDELASALQETWNAEGEVVIANFIEKGPPKRPAPRPQPRDVWKHARLWVKVSAETLDMPVKDFLQAMRDGQTPAQIAEEHGSSGQTLVDAIVAAEKERLDQAVTDGRMTQERADEILARITEQASTWVEKGFPKRPPRPSQPPRP